jgi:hypothetical protein
VQHTKTGLAAAREEFGVDARVEQPVRGAITPVGGVGGLPLGAKSLPTLNPLLLLLVLCGQLKRGAVRVEALTVEWTVDSGLLPCG